MPNDIHIVLITGFLGSGKTTLVNRLIRAIPRHLRTVILMNEFGEIGIDGVLVQQDDYEVIEINKGSIFCICVKTDFIKALHRIAETLSPDLLIIESTGVANPGDLQRDLTLPLFKGRFQLLEQVCVLDALAFEDAYEVFGSIEKQLESSTLFVLNKVDLASFERIDRVKEIVSSHNPEGRFMETVFCELPMDEILAGMGLSEGKGESPAAATGVPAGVLPLKELSPEEMDAIVKSILADFTRDVAPPDVLASAVFRWRGEGTTDFMRMLGELPKGIVRGKGFLKQGERTLLLNLTMGRVTLDKCPPGIDCGDLLGKVVLIFPPDLAEAIRAAAAKWSKLDVPLSLLSMGNVAPFGIAAS